ncbi:MAG: hypothetical protein ACREEM_04200 [Blastocatellia bacterium]
MKIIISIIRILLGIIFITYGAVKLGGGQYYYGDFVIDSKTIGPSATFFVWAFFGYSKVYAAFTGMCELGAGALLLIPRTATLGAAAVFAVALNITVMTFGFGFPGVKYLSLSYTVLSAVLLAWDYNKLKLIFWDRWQVEAALALLREQPALVTVPVKPPMSLGKRLIVAAVIIPVFFIFLNAAVASLTPGPEDAARAQAVAQGWEKEDLVFKRSRYGGTATSGIGLNRQGSVWFEVKGSNPPKLVRVDVHRPHSFVGWRIDGVTEESQPQQ